MIALALLLLGAPAAAPMTAYETQGRYIEACATYFATGNESAIAVDVGSDVTGSLECDDYAEDVANEPAFRKWYAGVAKRWRLSPDPDDRAHFYNYRWYWRDLMAGKAAAPVKGRFPGFYMLAGHPDLSCGQR